MFKLTMEDIRALLEEPVKLKRDGQEMEVKLVDPTEADLSAMQEIREKLSDMIDDIDDDDDDIEDEYDEEDELDLEDDE